MDVKWFFVIIGIFLTFAILTGMYFIGTFIALNSDNNAHKQIDITKQQFQIQQDEADKRFQKSQDISSKRYQEQLNATEERFINSTLVHKFLFDNITGLKKGLDPILAVIPNATQAEKERQLHYNQTTEDFEKIAQVLQIKLLDHKTLDQLNKTMSDVRALLMGNKNVTDTSIPTPLPAPIIINNDTGKKDNNNETGGIIIENITGMSN